MWNFVCKFSTLNLNSFQLFWWSRNFTHDWTRKFVVILSGNTAHRLQVIIIYILTYFVRKIPDKDYKSASLLIQNTVDSFTFSELLKCNISLADFYIWFLFIKCNIQSTSQFKIWSSVLWTNTYKSSTFFILTDFTVKWNASIKKTDFIVKRTKCSLVQKMSS